MNHARRDSIAAANAPKVHSGYGEELQPPFQRLDLNNPSLTPPDLPRSSMITPPLSMD